MHNKREGELMAEPTKTVGTGDVVDRIEKLSGVNFLLLPIGCAYMWFGTVNVKDGIASPGPPTVFVPGTRSPLDKTFTVIAMYQNEDEVRVYCVPTEDAAAAEEANAVKEKRKPDMASALRPKRYTLMKLSPTFFVEQMINETFQAEIAAELRDLRDATTLPEDLEFEKIECSSEDCDQLNDHDASFCKACGESLEEAECGNCGETVDDDDKFCKGCGESLEVEEEDGDSPAPPAAAKELVPSPRPQLSGGATAATPESTEVATESAPQT
jgi:hypothetical protein